MFLHNKKCRHAVLFYPQICYDASRFESHYSDVAFYWLETSFETSLSISREWDKVFSKLYWKETANIDNFLVSGQAIGWGAQIIPSPFFSLWKFEHHFYKWTLSFKDRDTYLQSIPIGRSLDTNIAFKFAWEAWTQWSAFLIILVIQRWNAFDRSNWQSNILSINNDWIANCSWNGQVILNVTGCVKILKMNC